MAAIGPAGDCSEAVELAWRLYQQAWHRGQSLGQEFVEFGNHIKALAENLNNVVRVVENARLQHQQQAIRSPNFRGVFFQKEWDLSSLYNIVGPFKATLTDCEQLLFQDSEAYRSSTSTDNNERTLVITSKIDNLQKRVRSHSARIATVLKPLEVKLLADIRDEFSTTPSQHGFSQSLPPLPLQGLLVFDLERAIADSGRLQPLPLSIPQEIEPKIRTLAEQLRPELRGPGGLPLQDGLGTFLDCYEQSTKNFVPGSFLNERTPTPKQYINFLTCLNLLPHLQDSGDLKRVTVDSLWPAYITELSEVLRLECQRFEPSHPQRLVVPDMTSLRVELDQHSLENRQKEKISKLMSPHVNIEMEEVFNVTLPCPEEMLQRNLLISRQDPTKLRLVESIVRRDSPSSPLSEIVLDIDVTTIQLTPIYATPSSRPRPLEVLLHTGTSQINPCFRERKHVLRLQHLLTGYRVYDRYDQAMVKVSFFIAGQSAPVEEHGRVQLWMPQPYVPANKQPPSSTPKSPIQSPQTYNGVVAHHMAQQNTAQPPPQQRILRKLTPQSPPELAISPDSPSKRTPSLRNFLPGKRRNSSTGRTLSNASSNRSSGSASDASSRSSLVAGSPIQNPLNSGSTANFGPFELPTEASMRPSYELANSGLIPAEPMQSPARVPAAALAGGGMEIAGSAHDPLSRTRTPFSPDSYLQFNASLLTSHPQTTVFSSLSPQRQSPQESNVAVSTLSALGSPHSPPGFSTSGHTTRPAPAPSSNYSTVVPVRSRVTPSVSSSMTARSHSSLASTVSTIKVTGASSGGEIARLHHKPQKPLLVIFLKSRDSSARLSIVAIQIDSHTSVKRERCECFNSHSACRISCVERDKGGSLLAQRWEANSGLGSWNLAKVGQWQRKDGQNVWPNVKRVSLKFEKMEDRYKFAGSPCSCNVKTTHELSRCNLDSHNGLFGIVKQIGEQKLRNYHNERDGALTKAMVLGPVPEGDL